MLLAIDIGNTNTVFGLFEGETLVRSRRIKTGQGSYRISEDKIAAVSGIIVSSVVPDADESILKFCRDEFSLDPVFITASVTGMEIAMDAPEEVGADRLVNAAAVLHDYEAPAIIVDFGTATTFDVVDAKGRYGGGVIAPGINLSLAALEKAAAKLPAVKIEKPGKVIGKDTKEAMQSGIYWGYVGLIEGLIAKITGEMGQKPFIVATGGLAPLFAPMIPAIEKVDQELTLKGLLRIYQAQSNTNTLKEAS